MLKRFFLLFFVFLSFAPSLQAQTMLDPSNYTPTACQGAGGTCSNNDGNCGKLGGNAGIQYDLIGYCDSAETASCCKIKASSTGPGTDDYCINTLKGTCYNQQQGCASAGSGSLQIGTCSTIANVNSPRICCSAAQSSPATLSTLNYTLLEEIPGQAGTQGDLASYLTRLYKFTFWGIGIAALFMLTVGGFMYVTSAGNTSRISTAKTVIVDSLLGIIIALFAWLFLYVLNPDLVESLRLPGLSTITVPTGTSPTTTPSTPGTTCPNPNDDSASCCPTSPSIACQACSNCMAIPAGVPNKGCGLGTCFLNSSLLSKIQNISGASGWRITESWPPTVGHLSGCHTNGTCADINNSGGGTDPSTIKVYYDAFRAAGLNVLYENSKDCTPYTAVGINCKSYSTQTNLSSFHVY